MGPYTGATLIATRDEWSAFLHAASTDREHPWIHRHPTGVRVRKNDHELGFTPSEWTAFIDAIHLGECEPFTIAA